MQFVEIVGSASAFLVAAGVLGALLFPAFRDWFKTRLDLITERGKAGIGLASQYYQLRLSAYLEIWRLTNEAVRAVYNAYNPKRPEDTPDMATAAIATLKNYFWDNRPLLSIGVFGCVAYAANTEVRARRLSYLQDRDDPDYEAVRRRRWERLEEEVKYVQGALLRAIDADLRLSGLPTLVGEGEFLGPSGEEREAAIEGVVVFVGKGEERMPWVGRSFVLDRHRPPAPLNTQELIRAAVQRGYLLEEMIADDGRQKAALRVNRENEHARGLVEEEGVSSGQPMPRG